MRKILFRGFQPCDGPETIVVDGEKVKGRWVEGYIAKHPSAIQIGNDYSPWYIHVPPVDPDDNGGVFNVLPSTVGQYSGLTDKNGKRIFESDIITTKYGRACKVTFKALPSFCGFDLDPINGDYQKPDRHDIYLKENLEVIGTVFDEEAHNAKT